MPQKPEILSLDDLEAYASLHLPKMVHDYYSGGALDSITLKANLAAYHKYYIRPRVLRNVSQINTKCRVFPGGNELSFPCCVAPAAMQRLAHPEGEEAMARACGAVGTVMGLSSFATTGLETVKEVADRGRWEGVGEGEGEAECVLQMYLFENREVSEGLIRRAEKAGYKAIVLTVDTPYFGRRLTEMRNGFKLPPYFKMANFDDSLGVKTGSELRTEELQRLKVLEGQESKVSPIKAGPPPNKNDPSMTWDVISYLRTVTKLPIWLKGILTAEDALLAVEHGADAIVVSNHGGRQLDYAPPTLDVLPEIVAAVQGRIPVHFDGGVRRGSDIFKALCLGADMVWIGRPALWGITYDGENGVKIAMKILEDEFKACMGLAGCTDLKDLNPKFLRRVDEVSKL